jgi:hypothetical protein
MADLLGHAGKSETSERYFNRDCGHVQARVQDAGGDEPPLNEKIATPRQEIQRLNALNVR